MIQHQELTPRENSLLVSGMANIWGWPLAHSSFTNRPRVMDPRAPPLVKEYLSKMNFMKSAAYHSIAYACGAWTELVHKQRATVMHAHITRPCVLLSAIVTSQSMLRHATVKQIPQTDWQIGLLLMNKADTLWIHT